MENALVVLRKENADLRAELVQERAERMRERAKASAERAQRKLAEAKIAKLQSVLDLHAINCKTLNVPISISIGSQTSLSNLTFTSSPTIVSPSRGEVPQEEFLQSSRVSSATNPNSLDGAPNGLAESQNGGYRSNRDLLANRRPSQSYFLTADGRIRQCRRDRLEDGAPNGVAENQNGGYRSNRDLLIDRRPSQSYFITVDGRIEQCCRDQLQDSFERHNFLFVQRSKKRQELIKNASERRAALAQKKRIVQSLLLMGAVNVDFAVTVFNRFERGAFSHREMAQITTRRLEAFGVHVSRPQITEANAQRNRLACFLYSEAVRSNTLQAAHRDTGRHVGRRTVH